MTKYKKIFASISLFVLLTTNTLSSFANYDKPIAPSNINSSTVTAMDKILDTVYAKKDNKVKYPTDESFTAYLDKVNTALNGIKAKLNSTDIRYSIVDYIINGVTNIKNSITSNTSDDILSSIGNALSDDNSGTNVNNSGSNSNGNTSIKLNNNTGTINNSSENFRISNLKGTSITCPNGGIKNLYNLANGDYCKNTGTGGRIGTYESLPIEDYTINVTSYNEKTMCKLLFGMDNYSIIGPIKKELRILRDGSIDNTFLNIKSSYYNDLIMLQTYATLFDSDLNKQRYGGINKVKCTGNQSPYFSDPIIKKYYIDLESEGGYTSTPIFHRTSMSIGDEDQAVKNGCKTTNIDGFNIPDLKRGESKQNLSKKIGDFTYTASAYCEPDKITNKGILKFQVTSCNQGTYNGYDINRVWGEGYWETVNKKVGNDKYKATAKCTNIKGQDGAYKMDIIIYDEYKDLK